MTSQPITIGKPERRKDLRSKVTGAARFTADLELPGARVAAVLRSPHHHARLLRIDTERARALRGVLAVVTGADIPGEKSFGSMVPDQPALAYDIVRHLGEPVALVVAADERCAMLAIDAIEVVYEPLPAVFDPIAALEPGAPQLYPSGNLLCSYHLETGDVQAGFAQADLWIEKTFELPRVAPAYLETECSAAVWNPDGSLTVWACSQHPFVDQDQIARVLGMALERIQVKSAVIGGAFGGKEDSELAVLAALGAWATRGAVRLSNSRSASFLGHPKRHPARLRCKIGARKDGSLTAIQALAYLETGAYASLGPGVGGLLTELLPGAYRFPNAQLDTHVVYTNSPLSGAVRGFGSPQAHFAIESLMDDLAHKLGMDPLELRRKNVLRPGDKLVTGVTVNETALSLPHIFAAADAARRRLQAIHPAEGKTAGVGLALGMQSMGLGAKVPDDFTQRLEWLPDGSVQIFLGAPDLGQGLATAAEQMTAEALDIPYGRVQCAAVDTQVSPNGGIVCASHMTYSVGNALLLAADQLKEQLLSEAARLLKIPRGELSYADGAVLRRGGERLAVDEITSRAADDGVRLQATGTFSFPYPPETTPMDLPIGMPHVLFGFGGHVARVEVDLETGQVTLTHLVAIHDAGKVINRLGVEGQIEGGAIMGIGYALYENMPLKEDGRWVDSLAEYLLPTSVDGPPHFESLVLEVPEASGPFGAKGIGEIVVAPVAPAVANAVFVASGVRVTRLPITPERLQPLLRAGANH